MTASPAHVRKRESILHQSVYWGWYLLSVVRRLGIRGAAAYLCKERMLRALTAVTRRQRVPKTYRLYSPLSQHSLVCRFGTTDREVFAHVFVSGAYDDVDPQRAPRFIIDGGANVGYSSVYFLSRFPLAHVLAVEPDDRNFQVLLQNLAPHRGRATALRGAIWSRCTGLILSRGTFGDGREWATQVLEDPAREADLEGFDVGTLLARFGDGCIDLLKLDVEGSEREVFRQYESWLHRVDTIAIELHDKECRDTFFRTLSTVRFDFLQRGEVTFARHPLP
jgi:FkbM family methyltransferase